MDSESLVEKQLEEGQKLVEGIARKGFPVAAALWLRSTFNDKWYFYVVSPLVDEQGLAKAYGELSAALRAIPRPLWIDPVAIRLIGPGHPIAKDVLAIYESAAGPKASPIRWRGIYLGNLSVDGVYLYPLPEVVTP